MRPATPTERLYAKRQCIPIMERCGSPGILVAELDDSGTAFYSHWDIWDPAWKTPEFSVELDAMIEMLRSDQRYGPVLKNIPAMIAYCLNNQESRIIQSPEYLLMPATMLIYSVVRHPSCWITHISMLTAGTCWSGT